MTVTPAIGKSVTGIQLKIAPGSVLSLRVNDPSNLLAQVGKSGERRP